MPSEILWEYMVETAGLMTNPADGTTWPLYKSSLPDGNETLNNCGAVFNTSGLFEGKNMRAYLDQRYGIQIRIRSTTEEEGFEKAKEIEENFKDVHNQDISIVSGETWRVQNIQQTSPIVPMGVDEQRRYHFSLNFLMVMKTI